MQLRVRMLLLVLVFVTASLLPQHAEVSANSGYNYVTWAPWRTQLDGSYHASANCGPAALGMVMAKYDEWWSTTGIRNNVNAYQRTWQRDMGSSWEALAYSARIRGFEPYGLYSRWGGYNEWTMDELMEEVSEGNPVILLVRLKYLPGHSYASWNVDHYIVFLGLDANGNVVYHDPAGGAYMKMSRSTFRYVYGNTASGLNWTGMSLRWVG